MLPRIVLALVALAASGCLGPGHDETDAADASLRNPIHLPIVGLLDIVYVRDSWRNELDHGWCAATLVSPRVAITSKMCLGRIRTLADLQFQSDLGTAAIVAAHEAGEPAATLSPRSGGWSPPDDFAALVLDHDLPVTADQLRSIRLQPLDPRPRSEGGDLGRTVAFVGYGTEVISPPGGRRVSTNWIGSIADGTFELSADGDHPCLWDHGDPVFAGSEIIGVVAHTFNAPSFDRHGNHVLCRPQTNTRIDRHMDVVQRALDDAAARTAAAAPAAAEPAPAY